MKHPRRRGWYLILNRHIVSKWIIFHIVVTSSHHQPPLPPVSMNYARYVSRRYPSPSLSQAMHPCFSVISSLTVVDARAFRILTLTLQKRREKLDSLTSAIRFANEASAHMRVIKCKHFLSQGLQQCSQNFVIYISDVVFWRLSSVVFYAPHLIKIEFTSFSHNSLPTFLVRACISSH